QAKVAFTGAYSTLIIIQQDKTGVIAHITRCLSEKNVNIAYMKLYREEKGSTAYSITESDGVLPAEAADQIRTNSYVQDVMLIQPHEKNEPDLLQKGAASPSQQGTNESVSSGTESDLSALEAPYRNKRRFRSGIELLSQCENSGCLISDIMLQSE